MNEEQKYIQVFISESVEILQAISDELLELESDPQNTDLINKLFRNLHTLKGGAALDGLDKISNVAHIMEDIFGAVRDNDAVLKDEYIDTFFDATDLLKDLVEGIGNGYDSIDNSEMVSELEKIKKDIIPDDDLDKGRAKSEELLLEKNEADILLNTDKTVYNIECSFNPGDMMKNVNSFIILNNIKPISDFIKTSPKESEVKNAGFEKFNILMSSSENKDKIESMIKTNCPDVAVNILGEDDINAFLSGNNATKPAEKSIVDIIDEILYQYSQTFIGAIEDGEKVWLVELNYDISDNMKGIMAYIVYNNLKSKSSCIVSSTDPEQFKTKQDLSKIFIYLSSKKFETKDQIELLIKANCGDFSVSELGKDDLKIEKKEDKQAKPPVKQQLQPAFVEVDKDIVEGVIENIGELVMNLNVAVQLYNDILENNIDNAEDFKSQTQMIGSQLNASAVLCNSLMDYAVLLKLVPVRNVFKKFPRIVRDISKKVGKKVRLVIEGERTRIDQEILEAIEAPILHMMRNSLDHGIEDKETREQHGKPPVGTITLRAVQIKDKVDIELIDDGKGLDKEKILKKAIKVGLVEESESSKLSDEDIYAFIFNPGFSTSEKVSQISGRGVGMDVVATQIKQIGGDITIRSEIGKGTKIILNLPITK